MITSFRNSLQQLRRRDIRSSDHILEMLQNEIEDHLDFYSNFHAIEENDIRSELDRFIKKSSYGSLTADIVLHALANTFKATISILEKTESGCALEATTENNIYPHRTNSWQYEILILRKRDHYDAIVGK